MKLDREQYKDEIERINKEKKKNKQSMESVLNKKGKLTEKEMDELFL